MSRTSIRVMGSLVAIAMSATLFSYLYWVSRKTVLNEIRAQALGVATAASAGIEASDVEAIRTPNDQESPPYQRIQRFISRIAQNNQDVLYVYVMRRSTAPEAKPSDLLYVVDQATSDDNQNGQIDKDELPLPVGEPYDASELPAMVKAWSAPAADDEPSSDPPYPDSLSGYAPIRDASGATVAIVGADIITQTISAKMLFVRLVHITGFLLMSGLLVSIIFLYLIQRDLAHTREGLIHELREALGNVRTLSGLLPICASCKRIRNESGEWERVETYVGRKSEAEFSHSICPECTKRLYPEAIASD